MDELTELMKDLKLNDKSSTKDGPDIAELSKKAKYFRKKLKKLGKKKKEKEKFINEIQECISLAQFSQKNINRIQEGILKANPGLPKIDPIKKTPILEPLDWVLTLEMLVQEVIIHRVRFGLDFGDHDVNMKVKELLPKVYQAGKSKKKKSKKKSKRKSKKLKRKSKKSKKLKKKI
tara:strand:+ start:3161 stop:3688 length:528 start_codon:yes stop_codon:yes gene_type:complete